VKWTGAAAGVLTSTHASPLQELEESRKLYTSQKRALKDALSAAAERDAAEAAAGESGLEAATAAAEEEVERLTQVCGHSRILWMLLLLLPFRESGPAMCTPHMSSAMRI
jgi:hypothetical protein